MYRTRTRTIKEYAVTCSRCGEQGPWERSRENARDAAEAEGWGWTVDEEMICTACQDEPEVKLACALSWLDRDYLLREAYRYALSFPGDIHKVRGAAEIDGLPRFVMYYLYLARSEVVDHRLPCGIVAYDVREPEHSLFPELKRWGIRAVALWEENGRVEYRTGRSVHEAVYGE